MLKVFDEVVPTDKKHHGGKEAKTELPPKGKEAELPAPEEKKQIPHEEGKLLHGPERVRELEERVLRLQAEFENYKKRAEKENDSVRENATAEVMLRLLPIVDDFGAAMEHAGKSPQKDFFHGVELIYAKLIDLLRREGVHEMKCLGEGFDPYRHDALRQAEGEQGKIVEVIQKGYIYKGKVLRHAKVAVGAGKEAMK